MTKPDAAPTDRPVAWLMMDENERQYAVFADPRDADALPVYLHADKPDAAPAQDWPPIGPDEIGRAMKELHIEDEPDAAPAPHEYIGDGQGVCIECGMTRTERLHYHFPPHGTAKRPYAAPAQCPLCAGPLTDGHGRLTACGLGHCRLLDAAPAPAAQGTPSNGDWWCPACKEALPWSRVTFSERCDTCGTPVTVAGEGDVARLERELAQAQISLQAERERVNDLKSGVEEANKRWLAEREARESDNAVHAGMLTGARQRAEKAEAALADAQAINVGLENWIKIWKGRYEDAVLATVERCAKVSADRYEKRLCEDSPNAMTDDYLQGYVDACESIETELRALSPAPSIDQVVGYITDSKEKEFRVQWTTSPMNLIAGDTLYIKVTRAKPTPGRAIVQPGAAALAGWGVLATRPVHDVSDASRYLPARFRTRCPQHIPYRHGNGGQHG